MAEKEPEASAEFVRLLSHQMKAPVHAIQSLLGAIEEGYAEEVPHPLREALDRVAARAQEAGQLVDDLLEYEASTRRLQKTTQQFELVDLLSELGFRFSTSAAARDVAVDLSLSQNLLVYLAGSRTAVEHAVRNLLDNAVKYTPPLGRVELSLTLDTQARRARIAIQDTGGGIPAEEREQLFRPFFRSASRRAKSGGSGLGLAIAQRIVASLDGSIEVSSEDGVGSTFTIVVPFLRTETVPEQARRRRRVVIIGGVTSGPKAAARLRRLDEELDITIIERNEFLSYAGCELPYFISNSIGSSQDISSSAYRIVRTAHFFDTMKNITVLNMTAAEQIDRTAKRVKVRRSRDGKLFDVPYDELILATGSHPSIPSIPGTRAELVFPLHSLEDAKLIKSRLGQIDAQDVVIVGGGLIGISTIQSLLDIGARVTVVEREATILRAYFDRDFARHIENALKHRGVKIAVGSEVSSITRTAGGVAARAGEEVFSGDLILLGSGLRPNSDLARSCGLELGRTGGIKVDEQLRTSDPSIFAVGDCAETMHLLTGRHEFWPLGSISVKMGRIAADVIAGREARFHGSLGTALLGCADLKLARTGLTTERARAADFDPVSFVLAGPDRPAYGGATADIYLKVIADRATRRLLGAQAYGPTEVAAKISLLAAAIGRGMTSEEVFALDLGHSPEINLPIDVVQTACLMLNNKIDGLLRTIAPAQLDEQLLVAVTTPQEAARDLIPGSLELNPESLRKSELPFGPEDEVVLYSRTSLEAYQAYRYLVQRGYKRLLVLEGGSLFWR